MKDNKIEQFLIKSMYSFEEIEKNVWAINDEAHDIGGTAIVYTDPIVTIRVAVMDVPDSHNLELYAKLLEFNAKDVVHGAYAIDHNQIILIDTLEYNTMDFEEFIAILDSFSLALTQHYPVLLEYRNRQ
jgi:hypothetical protein